MMSGGGMTLDSGFHYCDSIRYFFGDVDKVYAEMRELRSGQPMSVLERPEDSIYVTLSFKNGVVGTWAWSVAAPGESLVNVAFYGSEGEWVQFLLTGCDPRNLQWLGPQGRCGSLK